MKILFGVQGTGNGHVSRAREIIPHLRKYAQVDVLLSGTQVDVDLSYPIKYRMHGLGFTFGKSGGINYWETFKNLRGDKLVKEIASLPISDYDFIISDFEPVSAWAAYFKEKMCVGLSHQSAFLSPLSPRPAEREKFGEFLLRKFVPINYPIAFHFQAYDSFIHTPIIRSEIRQLQSTDYGHITVYHPAFDDKILIQEFKKIKNFNFEIFSKHARTSYADGNVKVSPIDNNLFLESFASCYGVICAAGFETPAEALFLGKKLLVIPMQGQYEQKCNAAALAEMGVPVFENFETDFSEEFNNWIFKSDNIKVDYPDETEKIVEKLFSNSFSLNPMEQSLM